MLRTALTFRRSAVVLGAGLLAGAVLTGCGAAAPTRTVTAAATGSASGSAAPESSAPASSAPDSALTRGLLSAKDIGADEVHQFPVDGTGSPDHPGPWGWWGGGVPQVTPAACATAVQDAMSGFPGLQDGVGQVARAGDVRTFEVLAVPKSPVKAVDEVRSLMKACDGASIERGNGDQGSGSVTVKIAELSGVPDRTAAFSVTISGDRPDGTWSTTALVGVGDDGDRVLGLGRMSWGGQLDTAAFTDLLGRAYQVQHDALG